MKKTCIMLGLLCLPAFAKAQTQLTASELDSLYTTTDGSWVSIHDPSVVYRDGSYYIWGSHLGVASSSDLITFRSITAGGNTFRKLASQGASSGTACSYASAFNTQQVTTVKNYKGETVSMPNFDAAAYCARYADDKDGWLSGVMWAPDIIWNEQMQKWCMYLSLNGDNWSSIIILLTSDSPTSGFTYQAPVVMGGFNGQTYSGVAAPKIGETDLEIATGDTSIPARYNQSDNGKYWPNCIDPCVFFDENGELWMTYGSWSGGIFMLKLDKETGLRDYTYTYTSDYPSKGASGTSDPYYGLKIAGGYYVSGEGSYIQHIGNYYYLFMSYGAFDPAGGYEMRIFRSETPEGPYKDASGNVATYTGWQLNYGPGADTNKGMLLMEAYNDWGGIQDVGERAQGHNSACQDDEGRNFVMYHTKFNDGTDGHQVRVHQLFTNENGWLVAAPFIYQGETTTDESIATSQPWTLDELTGDYEVLMHPYKLDHDNYEEMIPSLITLDGDGKITGELTGTWGMTEGTGYIWVKVSGTTYYGVLCEQSINGVTTGESLKETSLKAIAFTAMASSGVPLWGYKLQPDCAIAWNYKNNTINVKDGQTISSNVSLMFDTDNNTTLTWTSSNPDVINETGKYAPAEDAVDVTLTARLECGDYFWSQDYGVKAQKEVLPSGDYLTGLVAYYNFDETPTYNQYKPATETSYDRITYGKFGSGTAPTLVEDYDRFGKVAHVELGASGSNSYARMSNPLQNQDIEGFTVSAWIKRTDDDVKDALWGFFNTTSYSGSSARFFLTGNTYLGYDDNSGTTFKINAPDEGVYSNIPVGEWTLVTVTVGASNYVRIYINGTNKSLSAISASNGATRVRDLPLSELIASVTDLKYFYLGNGSGSDGGSADYCIDDLMIYNRELSSSDVSALRTMCNRVTDFTVGENGTAIDEIQASPTSQGNGKYGDGIYDLSGRRIAKPATNGIYIQNGKKLVK